MKNIVYSLIVLGSVLQADSTAYTKIAWTEVPQSAFNTAEFYNQNRVEQKSEPKVITQEYIEPTPVIEESSLYEIGSKNLENIDDDKEEVVKLDIPTWIVVE
jgi:hypothetical protein